mmetsp:Transcript_14786/g.24653  ORF Transcript_14786/g.24653 Transcript_14786/m.24653 type:complete len:239 (+) Transcript_14786:123-839(+)
MLRRLSHRLRCHLLMGLRLACHRPECHCLACHHQVCHRPVCHRLACHRPACRILACHRPVCHPRLFNHPGHHQLVYQCQGCRFGHMWPPASCLCLSISCPVCRVVAWPFLEQPDMRRGCRSQATCNDLRGARTPDQWTRKPASSSHSSGQRRPRLLTLRAVSLREPNHPPQAGLPLWAYCRVHLRKPLDSRRGPLQAQLCQCRLCTRERWRPLPSRLEAGLCQEARKPARSTLLLPLL